MKKIYYYISLLTILLVTSCQQEIVSDAPALKAGEYRFTVNIPEPRIATRAMGYTPATDLPLHVLVFDENGFFVANQPATVNSFDGTQGTYTVQLPPSDRARVLHFVLGNVEFGNYVPDDSEASIFSQLTVTNGTDAYWQRITVPNIQDGMTLREVSLVRNFAKIVVSEELDQLNLLGYAVVCETTEGTVAPYAGTDASLETNGGFATFDLSEQQEGTVYEQFTSRNPGFGGNNAGSVDRRVPQEADFTDTPKYVYERNQDEASSPAFILVRAEYNGGTYYYKLDLVETDPSTYITSYLNLYRNFQYTIRITSVSGVGYDTPEEAISAVASNNIGASVEVSEVNTIQDGKNELYVSETDLLVVTSDVVTIDYEYREGIDQGEGTLMNEKVKIFAVGGSEDGLNPNAVSNFTYGDGKLNITPASLPALMEEQEFIVTTPSGLSRRILLRVHEPFRFRVVDCTDDIPKVTGSDVALTIGLPANMPTSAFPLTLDIEPERKSIYPDVTRNRIPVESEGNQTFSYQATISYNEYRLQNGTFTFYFKTNMASSATTITVTNPYFLKENNTARFVNDGDMHYGFINVRLASEGNGNFSTIEDLFTFNTYKTGEKKITLSFTLHEEGDGYTPDGSTHPIVEIYGDYMDWRNAESSTGTFEVDPDGDGIYYTPNNNDNNIYSVQSITFTITEDLATGRFQLESSDHGTAIVEYTTPPCTVRFQYNAIGGTQNVPNGATIAMYSDSGYRNWVADYTVGNNGEITIRSFVGFDLTTTLYFRYRVNVMGFNIDYKGEATVQQLINGTQPITLEGSF